MAPSRHCSSGHPVGDCPEDVLPSWLKISRSDQAKLARAEVPGLWVEQEGCRTIPAPFSAVAGSAIPIEQSLARRNLLARREPKNERACGDQNCRNNCKYK
jgi:hypothetical protein